MKTHNPSRNRHHKLQASYLKPIAQIRPFVEETIRSGNDVLLDIDVQGAEQLSAAVRGGSFAYPESLVMIFLMPPSMELLERRLRRRGTESDEAIQRRLGLASEEMTHWKAYDYVIVTGPLEDDVAQGKAIVLAEKCRAARQDEGRPWQRPDLALPG